MQSINQCVMLDRYNLKNEVILGLALEGGFPVVYVETLNYYVENWGKVDEISKEENMEIAHFWLFREAYYNESKRFETANKLVNHE